MHFDDIKLEYNRIYAKLSRVYSFPKPTLTFRKLQNTCVGTFHSTDDFRVNEIIIDNDLALNGDPQEITNIICHEFAHAILNPLDDTLRILNVNDLFSEIMSAKYLTPALRYIVAQED